MSEYPNYNETHKEYHLHGFDIVEGLRQSLGDNNIYEPFVTRPWFTQVGRVYIRKDVADPALITYLLLKKR